MLKKLQMYINGEWVDSHSTETIEVMNPSDDSVLGVITAGNSEDVDDAVAAAKAAFSDFSFSFLLTSLASWRLHVRFSLNFSLTLIT